MVKSSAGSLEIALPQENLPDPVGTNVISFSRFGGDVSMVVGHFNIVEAVNKLKASKEGSEERVDAKATHQFLMSLNTFSMMVRTVNEFADAMRAQGIKIPEPKGGRQV